MRKISPATGIATVALFFSLAGSGFAASHYLITSTSQIKPSVLSKLKGAGQSELSGPAGPAGPAGAAGAQGAPGPAGTFTASDLSVVDGPDIGLSPFGDVGDVGSSVATCPAGDTVVSGGYTGNAVEGAIDTDESSGSSWEVIASNAAPIDVSFQAVAVCAS
jgi:hypothetical protein